MQKFRPAVFDPRIDGLEPGNAEVRQIPPIIVSAPDGALERHAAIEIYCAATAFPGHVMGTQEHTRWDGRLMEFPTGVECVFLPDSGGGEVEECLQFSSSDADNQHNEVVSLQADFILLLRRAISPPGEEACIHGIRGLAVKASPDCPGAFERFGMCLVPHGEYEHVLLEKDKRVAFVLV